MVTQHRDIGLKGMKKASNDSSNPHSNTGLDSQTSTNPDNRVEARIDNLSLLWDFSSGINFMGAIGRWLNTTFDTVNPIGRKIGVYWDRCYSAPGGSLYSERDGLLGKIYCRLSVSGETCSRMSNLQLRSFALWCHYNFQNIRCSRIDFTIHDYSKMLQYENIEQALREENKAGFNLSDCVKNYGDKFHGWTVYLGRRTSDKFARIYNKYAESKGKINCICWESEYKGSVAQKAFQLYLEFPNNDGKFQRLIIDMAIGGFSFVAKIDKNVSRCKLLKWWQEWLDFLGCCPLKISVYSPKTSIAIKKTWVRRSVSKALSLISDAIGLERFQHYLTEILEEAKSRYTNYDTLLLQDYSMHEKEHMYAGIMQGVSIKVNN